MRRLIAVLGFLLAAPASGEEYLVRDALGLAWDRGRPSDVRQMTNRDLVEQGQLWFGNGFLRGIALFADCGQRWTVGEFVAYLNNTVYLFTPFEQAARAFLDGRGCRARSGATPEDLLAELTLIRTGESREWLQEFVQRARAPGADTVALVSGLVAGARLLELETQGKQPPVWRPGESGPR